MKKSLSLIIHLISILVISAGVYFLLNNSLAGYGLSWLNDTSFEESPLFSEMVSEDIINLKRYAILLNTFEGEGDETANLDKTIVTATTINGSVSYTMSDLIAQGERFGFFMDEDTHAVSYTAPQTEPYSYELRLSYKQYDPYYLSRLPYGPTIGLTDIRSLAVDALSALAEYYNLKAVYDTDITNFKYSADFVTDEGDEFPIENTSLDDTNVRDMGRYLIVGADGRIETNIYPQPAGVLDTDSSYELDYASDGDVLILGVDTAYIFYDRYRQGEEDLMSRQREVRGCLIAVAAAVIVALVSLVLWIRGFSEADRREQSLDRIPLEALIFLCGLFALIAYFVLRFLISNMLSTMFAGQDEGHVRMILRCILLWICALPALGSLYRRNLYGGWFKYSLTNDALDTMSDRDSGSLAWQILKSYGLFILVNVVLAGFIGYCYLRRRDAGATVPGLLSGLGSGAFDYYMYIAIILLIAFDVYVFVMRYRRAKENVSIRRAIGVISAEPDKDARLDESQFSRENLALARELNSIQAGLKNAITEQVKADRLKADLITNVSHDIRTPLTSIINYVDLLKREHISDPKVSGYIEVLDQKSQRLKNLTEDLLEASKASSGNIALTMERIDMGELASQTAGEFMDRFEAARLDLEVSVPTEPVWIMADGRYLWRVFENLFSNAAKYSLAGTRVYVDVTRTGDGATGGACFTIKNISREKLNISPDELTERFVRGEVSRSTEGSGLGLSIAQSLTTLMGGELKIEIDGDLYKASVAMDIAEGPVDEVAGPQDDEVAGPQDEEDSESAEGPAEETGQAGESEKEAESP